MPGPYPAPFGQTAPDGAALTDPADPRALGVGARAKNWPDGGGQAAAEARRRAKGQSPRTDDEIRTAMWGRQSNQRTPVPTVGQRLHFVRDEWGDTEPATVLEVQDPGDDDPNLRGPDPAPWATLQCDDGFVTRCREARVRGAAGWLVP